MKEGQMGSEARLSPPLPEQPERWLCEDETLVEEVNGSGAEELDGVRPTRFELKLLLRYWYLRNHAEYLRFLAEEEFDIEHRVVLGRHAEKRIRTIEKVLNPEEVREVRAEVQAFHDPVFSSEEAKRPPRV